jgi:ABC-type branched-subunit amino acid transport system substrate-binding protein
MTAHNQTPRQILPIPDIPDVGFAPCGSKDPLTACGGIAQSPSVVSVLLTFIITLFLGACAAPDRAQPTAPGDVAPVTIGFTMSKTGNLTVESTRQTNGLNLWMKQVNDAGGLTLKDGTVVRFEAKYYDDQSSKGSVQQLYTRLATKDNATFLISPYSSGLTDAAAVIAEQYGKIMITTGAASDSTYERGLSLVYQAYTPASRYLTGAVDLLNDTDPSAKRIAILHENDKFSTDVCNAVREYATDRGYDVVFFEGYDTGTTDFAPFINKMEGTEPDAILGGGHFQDGSTFAKQLYEKQLSVRMVALLVAPPESNFAEIGDAAIGIIGPSQWETQESYAPETAQKVSIPFYGPSSVDFTRDYKAAYGENPSYHAAGGYAAGLILQNAIETAGALDSREIQAVLDAMNILTFFGRIQFSASPDNHGLQIGHSMAYIQWQGEPSGALGKQLVWPEEVVTAEVVYPIR